MKKRIIFLIIILLLASMVFAVRYKYLAEVYRLDRVLDYTNLSDNLTVDCITLNDDKKVCNMSDINYTSSLDKRTATIIVAANNSLNKEGADFICDGVADDVTIESAMATLPIGGGKVVLLEGDYRLSDDIDIPSDNIYIQGQGTSTILHRVGNLFYIDGKDDITIENLYLNSSAETGVGIYAYEGVNRLKVTNNFLSGFSVGFKRFVFAPVPTFGERTTISGNTFQDMATGISLIYVTDNLIVGNIISNISYKGIEFGTNAKRNVITNNLIRTVSGFGIRFTGVGIDDNLILNNEITDINLYAAADTYGIALESGGKNNQIVGNIINDIEGIPAGGLNYGILLQGNNTIISGNRIDPQNSSVICIKLDGSYRTQIFGNQMYGIYKLTIDKSTGNDPTIFGNYPGGSSMEIQTAEGQEIKMIPEGTHTSTFYPNGTYFYYPIYGNGTGVTDVQWQNIDNSSFPVACPAGTAITELGTSVVCTATSTNTSGTTMMKFSNNRFMIKLT